MFKIKYTFTLDTKKYLNQLREIFGKKIIDNKYLFYPERIGQGYNYFIEVMPGVAIMLMNADIKVQVEVARYPTEEDLFILHYDLSDEIILLDVDNKSNKIGYKVNLGFALMDSNASSTLKTPVDSSFFALRLIVSKDFIYKYMGNAFLSEKNKQYYFHDHIDSNSILLIKSLKERNIFDDSFDFYLKGVALELLANFMERYSVKKNQPYKILQIELDSIEQTKLFLLDNLYGSFPSITFLAEMAGMSESKYKSLFKNIYQISPMKFFIREKMLVAGKLLGSGSLKASAIAKMLNYSSFSQFSNHYLSIFGYKPSEGFIKKKS